MRRWSFFLYFRVLAAQDYVCSVADFRRMIGNVQIKVEAYYSAVVVSSAELAETLTYSSAHPNYFPGVYRVADLTPCSNASDQFSLRGPNSLLGIHVLNRTVQGVDFDFALVEDELSFVTPIANFLPTIMSHNPDATTVYVAGLTLNCSTFYFYPPRDICGLLPMMDICSFFHERFNLFSRADELEEDFQQGGHWSEVYADSTQNLVITYSFPVKDSKGNFRGQLGLGVSNRGVQRFVEQAKPSQNGYTFVVTKDGHIIYATQDAIDILFGVEAKLTLRRISTTYTGLVHSQAITLRQSVTQFSNLPDILSAEDTNGSILLANSNSSNDGYYVAWARFEETLRTWFLVGVIPRGDIDNAAVWNITPAMVEVTLTDFSHDQDFSVFATNNGLLPVTFNVGSNPHARGILINSSDQRFLLMPGATQGVNFTVRMDPKQAETQSFTSHFVVPFYATSAGYGPCFKPQVTEIVVHVVRLQYYTPSRWALVVIYLLCAVTTLLVLLAFLLLFCFRYSPPVLALAPRLCVLKLLGLLFILGASAANIAAPTAPLCEATRWLFHIGFTVSVSAIASKNYRNRRIFTSKRLQVVALSDLRLLTYIAAVVLVDLALLTAAATAEPYVILQDGQCKPKGRIVYGLLVFTKLFVWLAAFWNTIKIDNVPSTFADTRLNGVLAIGALLTVVCLGLQFSGALADYPGTKLFLGSLFMWVGVFLVWGHLLLKLRAGYVTVPRPRSSTKRGSISLSISQPRLKERLEALLAEIEAQSTRLHMDKNNAIESVKANQRLMFEVRAELLAINTQAHLVDEELERFLPSSIKSAFDKFGPAMARRMDIGRPTTKPRNAKSADVEEAKQLLSVESPISTSPPDPSTSVYNTPQSSEHLAPNEEQVTEPRLPDDEPVIRAHSTPPSKAKRPADQTAAPGDCHDDETSSTQDEETPLQREPR